MAVSRQCAKTACGRRAIATLTYVYAQQTVVLGPLAMYAEPHSYDLCEEHAARMTAPRGWDIVRLAFDAREAPDDLVALAEAVREPQGEEARAVAGPGAAPVTEAGRRSHLRVLRDG